MQGKLLRVLQDKEFEPLGSNRIVRADVRIIAATSADLPALVAAGRFRADLFYRLNVLTIHAPPLRERLGDIEALAYAMLEELSAQARPGHAGHFVLQDDALRLLCAYCPWPGNVRELRNTLERALMLSDSEQIDARALAPFIGSAHGGVHRPTRPAEALSPAHAQARRLAADRPRGARRWRSSKSVSCDALRASGGRVTETAKRIGIGRATLYKKIAARHRRVTTFVDGD